MATTFELFVGENDEFYFHLTLAGDDEVILHSEGYTSKENCLKGIHSVKENAKKSDNYEKKMSKNGKFFFNIKAKNGQIVATSAMFISEQKREKAIAALEHHVSEANIVDLT